MDANSLVDHIVSLITCGNFLTPMKEINKGEQPDTLDLSFHQIVREPIIRLVDKNWGRFLANLSGNEVTLHKRVHPEFMKVKTCKEFGASRFGHCYEKNWRNAADSGTSWAVTKVKEHQDCDLHEASLLWLLDDHGHCGTSTSIQHPRQLQQSSPDGSCGWCPLTQSLPVSFVVTVDV